MIDWMVQVFRVMNRSSDETYFLAISIMDRYFLTKQQEGIQLLFQDLYLIGTVSIFIASKFEDVVAISMDELLSDVAHNKFNKS